MREIIIIAINSKKVLLHLIGGKSICLLKYKNHIRLDKHKYKYKRSYNNYLSNNNKISAGSEYVSRNN